MFQIRELNIFIFSLFTSKLRSQITSVSKEWLKLSIFVSKSLSKHPTLYDSNDNTNANYAEIKKEICGDYHLISRLKISFALHEVICNVNSENEQLDVINLMIEKGLRDWDDGLIRACFYGNLNIVKFIIKKGGDNWNKASYNGGLYCACSGNHLHIINLMIEKGAKNWNVGLYCACLAGHLNIVNLMIEKGAKNWNNGLREACFGGHLNIINFMIKNGANNWNIGLHGACGGGNLDIANLMVEKGATKCSNCGWNKDFGNPH